MLPRKLGRAIPGSLSMGTSLSPANDSNDIPLVAGIVVEDRDEWKLEHH